MRESLFVNGVNTGTGANTGGRMMQTFAASKEAVSEALADGRHTVKHLLKRTRYTMDDLMDDATHSIKRFPIRSVFLALGVGTLVGMALARNGRK